MNLKNRIIALVTATAIAVPALALAKHNMKAGKDKVPMAYFSASLSPTGTIEGKTADVDIIDDDNDIAIKVKLSRVETGMGLRNKHFQTEFLKQPDEKLNVARLTVKKAEIKGKLDGKEHKAKGTLKLNGKEKDVSVNFTAAKDGDRLKVTGNTNMKYTDFGFKKQCYAGVCVEEDVKLSVLLYVSPE